jgi:hypothetical protein
MGVDRDESVERGISVGIPLDEDGFVLRECPACEREFRWHVSADENEEVPAPLDGYFCPYCGKQASSDSWFTTAQADFLSATALHEMVGPQIDEMLGGLAGNSGLVRIEVTGSGGGEKPAPFDEDFEGETRRLEFSCHPTEPVKVALDWEGSVYCLICGSTK